LSVGIFSDSHQSEKGLVAALVEKLGETGMDPNDMMVFFLETDRASGSFGGGRFAPPLAFD
jgi:hypothetical protein